MAHKVAKNLTLNLRVVQALENESEEEEISQASIVEEELGERYGLEVEA